MRSPLVPLALFCAAALSVQAADLKLNDEELSRLDADER